MNIDDLFESDLYRRYRRYYTIISIILSVLIILFLSKISHGRLNALEKAWVTVGFILNVIGQALFFFNLSVGWGFTFIGFWLVLLLGSHSVIGNSFDSLTNFMWQSIRLFPLSFFIITVFVLKILTLKDYIKRRIDMKKREKDRLNLVKHMLSIYKSEGYNVSEVEDLF